MEINVAEVEVFCVVTPCNIAVGYQRFEEGCCNHPPCSGWMSAEALVSFRSTSWRHNTENLHLNFHRQETSNNVKELRF
jgi:hypothetical protein